MSALVAHYRVLEELGRGGMGTVFAAEDTLLGRRVALKFPSGTQQLDPLSTERFLREARSASSLNHAGICTIYQVGEHEGRPFLAMELVDGTTLSERIDGRPVPLATLLDLATQVADALDAAHTAGVIHRDIKPSNIMVTRRGQAKVMDFGLAKLVPQRLPLISRDTAPTMVAEQQLTGEGATIGTVAYMSPEQARGEPVDARSDLFSFGLVVYQMATGHLAFSGATNAVVFDQILNRAPTPLVYLNPGLPAELQRIIDKALEKDREDRYQTAADLRADLRRLRRHVESGHVAPLGSEATTLLVGGTGGPIGNAVPATQPAIPSAPELRVIQGRGSVQPLTATVPGIGASTAVEPGAIAHDSRTATASGAGRGLTRWLVSGAIGAVLVGAFAYVALRPGWRGTPAVAPFTSTTIEALTFSGNVGLAAISSDGRYMVHTLQDGRQSSLWMRQVATASHVQIVSPAEGLFDGLTLTPDGNYVYYVWYARGENVGVVFRLPTLGGTPQRVLDDVDTPIAFAPDGKRFAFLRGGTEGETSLVIADADGSDAKVLVSRRRPREFLVTDIGWSPDGKVIAVAGRDRRDARVQLVTVDVASGQEQPLTADPWFGFSGLVWRPDGRGLIVTGTTQAVATTGHQIFDVPWPAGPLRRLSSDLAGYSWPRLTDDGRQLAVVRQERDSQLNTLPLADPSRVSTVGVNGDGSAGLDVATDGAIAYTSLASGQPELWIAEPDRPPRALTSDPASEWSPRFTPDGQGIVFHSIRGDKSVLSRIDRSGGRAVVLIETSPTWGASITPDGRSVLFTDAVNGIQKIAIDGGTAQPVSSPALQKLGPGVSLIALSPDGTRMAVSYRDVARRTLRVGIVAADGSGAAIPLDLPARWVRFSADGQVLYYSDVDQGVGNVFSIPIAGGARHQVTRFQAEVIGRFAVGATESLIAVNRGSERNNVVLLKDQRPPD